MKAHKPTDKALKMKTTKRQYVKPVMTFQQFETLCDLLIFNATLEQYVKARSKIALHYIVK